MMFNSIILVLIFGIVAVIIFSPLSVALSLREIRRQNKAGQTTLEFTLCFVVLIIIFLAGFLAFKWAGETMTRRQINFEQTRGNPDLNNLDFYTTPPMNLHIGVSR